jgi:hypothetical protein
MQKKRFPFFPPRVCHKRKGWKVFLFIGFEHWKVTAGREEAGWPDEFV